MSDHAPGEEEKDPLHEAAEGGRWVSEPGRAVGEAAEAAGHHVPGNAAWMGKMFPWLQAVAGVGDVGEGIAELQHGHYVDGGMHIANGARETTLGGAAILGRHAPAPLEALGPLFEGYSAGKNFRDGNYASGILDSVGTVLSVAVPELLAPWKIGQMAGKGLQQTSAQNNVFGGHRTASTASADTGDKVRRLMDQGGASSDVAGTLGGVATLGSSVLHTAESAIDAVVVPPIVRDVLQTTRGGEGPAGIAGTGFSLSDLADRGLDLLGGEGTDDGGPTEAELITRFVTTTGTAHQALSPPGPSPYAGMYD